MRFDKSKVYSDANADELKIGSKVILAYRMSILREYVEKETGFETLSAVLGEDAFGRFQGEGKTSLPLAYLVE